MILVVDDEKSFRVSTKNTLEAAGWTVTAVASAEEGLEELAAREYDLVLLDLRMDPGMSGSEFMKLYKDISPITQVVVITAYADMDTAVESLSGGRDAAAQMYLEKPVGREQLLEVVSKLITQIRVGDFVINRRDHSVTYKGDNVPMAKGQIFKLFCYFVMHPDQWHSYVDLDTYMFGKKRDLETARTGMKTHVYRLRQALEDGTGSSDDHWIRTQRHVGLGFFP